MQTRGRRRSRRTRRPRQPRPAAGPGFGQSQPWAYRGTIMARHEPKSRAPSYGSRAAQAAFADPSPGPSCFPSRPRVKMTSSSANKPKPSASPQYIDSTPETRHLGGASSIDPGFSWDRSLAARRLSCVAPAESARRTGSPWDRPLHVSRTLIFSQARFPHAVEEALHQLGRLIGDTCPDPIE